MTEQRRENHNLRNVGLKAGGILLAASMIGACNAVDGKPSASPIFSPNQISAEGTPMPSAAGSNRPEASSEATKAPELVSIKDGSVGGDTIVKLPANTVITGDPFFFGGQPGNGQQLEDYQPYTFAVKDIASQSLVDGKTLTDSDPSTGSVWVLTQATYVQSATDYGFSYNTLQNGDMAENFAIGQQYVTKFLGCGVQPDGQKGCQRVDIMHVPGQFQGANGPENLDGSAVVTSSQAPEMPMGSQMPSASEMPGMTGTDLGNMTKEQEITWLEGMLSDKTFAETPVGQTLAELLLCLQCGSTVCETPTATASPTPKPSSTPSVCTPTEKDEEHAAGFTFDTHGQSVIIEGTATIDGHRGFTLNSPYKQIDVLADGKNHHVVIGYPNAPKGKLITDVQTFNNCADQKFIIDTYHHDLEQDSKKLDPKSIYEVN